jgi:aurora kinase, other
MYAAMAKIDEAAFKEGACPLLVDSVRRSQRALSAFKMAGVLHKGRSTRVLIVKHVATGKLYVVKQFELASLTESQTRRCREEATLHFGLAHRNVLPMLGWWRDDRHMCILLQHAPRGDLYKLLLSSRPTSRRKKTAHPPFVVALVLDRLIDALEYLHAKRIIHRDVKPENILVMRDYEIALADFGLSIDTSERRATSRVGTLYYIAPELMSGNAYDAKVDVWAVGVLAFELLTGEPPFGGETDVDIVDHIARDDVFFPSYLQNGKIEDFVRSALCKDPLKRPGLDAIRQHPWLAGVRDKYAYREVAAYLEKRWRSASERSAT